jgi:ornithine cyclodeaminase/alanine dehydrogenase-like protein (mu-crystallin family)
VSAIDLGYSWLPGLGEFERIVTDDRAQAAHEIAIRLQEFAGPYDTDVTELLTGALLGRELDDQRIIVAHGGHAIGILALAAHVYEKARDTGLSTSWPDNSV